MLDIWSIKKWLLTIYTDVDMTIHLVHPDGSHNESISATFIKSLARGFSLVYSQDRLVIVDEYNVIVESMDVINFVQNYL